MKKKSKENGMVLSHIRLPLALSVLLIIMNIMIYLISEGAGLLTSLFILVYFLIVIVAYRYHRERISNSMISFATQYGQIQGKLLKDLELPYALLDTEGKVIWANKTFFEVCEKGKKDTYKSITYFVPTINKDLLPDEFEEKKSLHIQNGERDYRVELQRISVDVEGEYWELIAIYLFDETQMNQYIREIKEQKLVAGLIYLDNYEEALETVEEVRRSLLIALVDRKISKYLAVYGGIVKKMEKDKYFVALQEKDIPMLKEMKFDLLDDVKSVNVGNEIAVTLSIGLGSNGKTYSENYEFARTAIDLALARGGDQVVIKEGEQITYFGGKTQQVEKTTRVKARVKAQALREFIETRDKVMVMGHRMTDVDSFGAAIGIYRAAKVLGKRAHIVINDITTSVRPMQELFLNQASYEPDMFLNSQQAQEMIDKNTVLVVVDTNRPNYTECSELLKMTPTIVVLDHHRQTNEQITGAVLSYIEPYASSACEMVAEILQYFENGIKLKSAEADCLYAGIIIDTDNFMSKTGVRTFEAAAFLRRCGADVTRVRKMFRNDMESYKARAEAVRHAEVYHGFAIAVCPNEHIQNPTIVGAQAANELLNIVGVKASIVFTEYQGKTYLSARSIDEINVQVIMEKIGGGGHLNMAGAQLQCGVEEAKEIVKHTLDKMIEEGELK